MKLIILALSLAVGTYSEDTKFTKLPANEEEYLVKLEAEHTSDLDCLKRIDTTLALRWNIEEKKIPIDDLGEIPEANRRSLSAIPSTNYVYNSRIDEWVLDSDIPPSQRIEKCLLTMIKELLPLVPESDEKCWDQLIESHITEEVKIEKEFDEFLNKPVNDQLLFRKFLNFREYVDMMFQNRTLDALSSVEEDVYEHMESYLPTEGDKDRKVFFVRQDCTWERFVALHEAPNTKAKFEEFVSQVRHIVNLKLGRAILPMSYVSIQNMTLIIQKRAEWLESREETMERLAEEVKRLKTEQHDDKWLCEYASKLANDIFFKQSSILGSAFSPDYVLGISETVSRLNNIEKILKKRNDTRQYSIHALSTNVDKDWICLGSFAHMVINHQNIAVISALTDSRHSYQELNCADHTIGPTPGLFNRYCKCVGSFCTFHGLYSPRSDDYELVQVNGAVYKIEPSNHLIWVIEQEREFAMRNSSEKMK